MIHPVYKRSLLFLHKAQLQADRWTSGSHLQVMFTGFIQVVVMTDSRSRHSYIGFACTQISPGSVFCQLILAARVVSRAPVLHRNMQIFVACCACDEMGISVIPPPSSSNFYSNYIAYACLFIVKLPDALIVRFDLCAFIPDWTNAVFGQSLRIVYDLWCKSANPLWDRYNFRRYAVGMKVGIDSVPLPCFQVFYDSSIVWKLAVHEATVLRIS